MGGAFGTLEEAVTARKRQHLAMAATIYLQDHSQEQREWGLDVVGIALQRNGRAVTNYVRGIDVE